MNMHALPSLLPCVDELAGLDPIFEGWDSDLLIDTGDHRLWLDREPGSARVTIEEFDGDRWLPLGAYNAASGNRTVPGVTRHAFRGHLR